VIGRKRNNNRSRDFAVRLKDTQIRDDSLDKKRIPKSLSEALQVIKIQICCLSFFLLFRSIVNESLLPFPVSRLESLSSLKVKYKSVGFIAAYCK
jgi:hypothetical protein